MTRHSVYHKRETAEVAQFVETLKNEAAKGGVFDSAAADDFVSTAINQSGSVKVPEKLKIVLDEADDKTAAMVTRAIFDGANTYERMHGAPAPADLLEQAIHLAYGTSNEARRAMLDSASSNASDPLSLQPNRAVVAILTTLSEAIPFAHYLPADIQSNEAKLAIMTHQAGKDYGRYTQGALMDGAFSGDTYISSSREHKCEIVLDAGNPTGAITGKLTSIQTDGDTCNPAAPEVKLLRGRSLVYVNGLIAAREVSGTGTGPSVVSGQASIAGTVHQISGTVHPDTGVIALVSTPPMAATNSVVVEGFIDYERAPELTPSIVTAVDTFQLFAKPWRVTTHQTIDSRTQMANELGLDPYSEGVIGIQAQFANERHYEVLRKAKRMAKQNTDAFDFNWSNAGNFKVRADVWCDFGSVLSAVSQRMAIATLNHGVTHLYVGEKIAAQLSSLPNEFWEPSGIVERPGIFRLGRLFGRYDVYYTPKEVNETEDAAEILCVGRATDVTRNPFVLGDAVAPTVIPLAVNADLKTGAGFYARNFTAVNPHQHSAMGCALITVTNLF
ncbi:hypothetical protein [Ectopseudomonas oleovorans]|uniref:hypothetical protein n=1 Tax=Ectopseudomonas oleovorans TaxID=301 RepID=UPI0019D1741B|nr:hypothetical protein [Pseudomonas oleovorans]MBN7118087.1 hypothetical protein [Pseudomonas oleovorans]MBN7132004.1 hypothetical protein [Pseudomonas oleovorans]MBN7141898.1 hypothetical protein [Pseudomonas oleovorans]